MVSKTSFNKAFHNAYKNCDYFLKDCATASYYHTGDGCTCVTTFEYAHYILNVVGGVLLSQEDIARSNF